MCVSRYQRDRAGEGRRRLINLFCGFLGPSVTFFNRVFLERGNCWAQPRKPGSRAGRGARQGGRVPAPRPRCGGWAVPPASPAAGPARPRSPGFLRPRPRRRPSPRPAFISPMPGCNPSFYFLVAPLRDRAQCWEFASVSALKLSRSMSRELSQFCLSVSLFQEGKHSRERASERARRAAGGRGAGAPAAGGRREREAGRLRPGSPRRAARPADPAAALRPGSHAPAARRTQLRRPPRPPRALADPRGGCRERCWKKLLK